MDPATHGPQVRHVKITNNNVFDIEDRFDGVKFTFTPKKPVTIPMDAARHIFGFHLQSTEQEVFNHVTRRLGWNTPNNLDQAKLYFDNIEIRPVVFRLVEVDSDGETEIEPEPVPERLAGHKAHPPISIDHIPMKPGRKRKDAEPSEDAGDDFSE